MHMIKTHLPASSMAGIGIYYFLFLCLTFSKCYEALNSYTKGNRETALFYSSPFTMKKKLHWTTWNAKGGKKKNQCNIRRQIQCYFSPRVLGSSHSSGRPCAPQASLTLLCLPRLGPAGLTAEPVLSILGKALEGGRGWSPSAPCCKALVVVKPHPSAAGISSATSCFYLIKGPDCFVRIARPIAWHTRYF